MKEVTPLNDLDEIRRLVALRVAEEEAEYYATPLFLQLTRRRSDRDAMNILYIRPEAIESISIDVNGLSVLNGNRYLTVTESPDEIFEMLKG
jgi:hypothetical protein